MGCRHRRSREDRSAATATPSDRARSRPMASGSSPAATTRSCGCGTCTATRKSACCTPRVLCRPRRRRALRPLFARRPQIVTASRDRTASLWDAATGERLRQFEEGHEFLVSGAAFFPDGKSRLATGAGDNSVRIWDVDGRHAAPRRSHPPAASARWPCRPTANGSPPAARQRTCKSGMRTPSGELAGDAHRPRPTEVSAARVFAQRRSARHAATIAGRRYRDCWQHGERSTARTSHGTFEQRARRSQRLDHRLAIHARRPAARSRPAATTPAANGILPPARNCATSCSSIPNGCRRSICRPTAHSCTHHVRRRRRAALAAGRCHACSRR